MVILITSAKRTVNEYFRVFSYDANQLKIPAGLAYWQPLTDISLESFERQLPVKGD